MIAENRWQHYNFETTIREILTNVHYTNPEHHFGRPFLTAYQVAIAFAEKAPEVVAELDIEIGGKGIGKHTSLAQYIAQRYRRRSRTEASPISRAPSFPTTT